MSILDVQQFEKRFDIHQLERTIPVFGGVDLALQEGQFLLVSGRNGVGKSTLLRCLDRSYLPTSGRAL